MKYFFDTYDLVEIVKRNPNYIKYFEQEWLSNHNIKTAISLEENLFNQVSQLANDMHVSRSKLFTLAVKDFLKKSACSLIAQADCLGGILFYHFFNNFIIHGEWIKFGVRKSADFR